jgi:hypothetical protein
MSYIDHFKRECEILGWPGGCEMQKMICDNIEELLNTFASQGHSGFSADYALGIFEKAVRFDPLTPLTGEDSEWLSISNEMSGKKELYQNIRCSEVFKEGKKGQAYWIHGKIFKEKNGTTYTSKDSRIFIDFPWSKPKPEIVEVEK